MYQEISIMLSAVSTLASVIQAVPVIIGKKTNEKDGEKKTKSIKIAQGLLYFGAFVAALPPIISLIVYQQSTKPTSGFVETYKFDSGEWYRIGWAIFLILAAQWLNNFKED